MSEGVIFRKGKKVILRPIEKRDMHKLVIWLNDPEITGFLKRRFPLSMIEESEWISNQHKRVEGDVTLAVRKINGPLIGTIGLHRINWVHGHATTGTIIGEKKYWSDGYGTDAKMLLLDFAFNELGLRKIYSRVLAFNGRSIRYSEKCGYKKEACLKEHHLLHGEYHDEIIMSVFKKDWTPLWQQYKKI